MTTIGEAYVHLKPYDIDAIGLDQLGETAISLAVGAFKEVYPFDGTIEVNIERGSAKVWITLLSTLSLSSVYDNIAKWPDFKAGVSELVQDAKNFGSLFNPAFIAEADAEPNQVFRTERRTKTPGKLKRGLDKLETAASDADVEAAMVLLRSALDDLDGDDGQALESVLQNVYPKAAPRLPAPEASAPRLDWQHQPPLRLMVGGSASFSRTVHTSEYSAKSHLSRLPKALEKARDKDLL